MASQDDIAEVEVLMREFCYDVHAHSCVVIPAMMKIGMLEWSEDAIILSRKLIELLKAASGKEWIKTDGPPLKKKKEYD